MEKHQVENDKLFKSSFCDSAVFFSKSRFFNIIFSEDRDKYTKETLDSAEIFFRTVGTILDTTCFGNNYLENRKLKN
jgi:hypothetical protein